MRVVREQPEKYFCAHLFNAVGQLWVVYSSGISLVRMDGEVENSRKYVEEAIAKECHGMTSAPIYFPFLALLGPSRGHTRSPPGHSEPYISS